MRPPSDYGYVLQLGGVALQGTAAALVATEAIRRSYLGTSHSTSRVSSL